MQYSKFTVACTIVFCLFQPKCHCHLKNMGEVTNFTKVLVEIEGRIVGGKPTSLDKFPFNVQFLNFGGMCGAAILTSKTVLTAAHCFDANTNIAEMRVFSNSRYLFDVNSYSHEVWDFVKHENYNNGLKFANDIAMIIIHDNFKYSKTVQRAVLMTSDVWMMEKEASFAVSGWGETQYGKKTSNEGLLTTNLRFISNKKCARMSGTNLSVDMFCLYGDGKRDTCRGDSGGGVMWKGAVVGIVSHGIGCAKTPGVYTKVNHFLSWIQSTANKLHMKFCHSHQNLHIL